MASSVTDVGNPQQGGKKDKDKNKDLSVIVHDKLAEINHSMSDLIGRVDDIEKHIEELEFAGDFEEFHREMQEVVKSLASNVSEEVQTIWASKDAEFQACRAEVAAYKADVDAHKAKIRALEVQLKLCMTAVTNMGNGGLGQVSTTLKANALQTPTCNRVRNTTEINNFFWKFKAYFGVASITDKAQNVNHAFFSLKDIALVSRIESHHHLGLIQEGTQEAILSRGCRK